MNENKQETEGFLLEENGKNIDSWLSMEPVPEYGENGGVYTVDVTVPGMPPTGIVFHSFEELQEFSDHLARYVEECRRRRNK